MTWPSVMSPARIFRRTQEDRDHCREVGARCRRDERRAHPLIHDDAPAFEQSAKMPGDFRPLLLLAAEQRNAFAVLAQPRHCIAKLGFALVLDFGCPHEAPADDQHRAGAKQRIEEGGDNKKARDVNCGPAEPEIERAADRPQHEDEGHRGQKCRQNPRRRYRPAPRWRGACPRQCDTLGSRDRL